MTKNVTTRRTLLPSLTDVIFSTTLAFLFLFGKGATSLLGDSDTGWHIRTGEWILKNWAVPRQDLFSFSKPGGEWFAWEWLSDVIFAVVHRYAGLAGLVVLCGIAIALVFALLYRLMLRRGADVLVAAAVALSAAYAASIHWLARPHVLSWVLALACYWMLEQIPIERGRIFWLAPLTVLWTNLHGSFVLVFFLVAVYAIGELLQAGFAAGPSAAEVRRRALLRAGRYGILLAACAAASLLNPYFYRVHLHVFGYLKNEFIFNHITEFFSPDFHFPSARFFELLLLLGLGSVVWAARRGRYAQALLVISFAHFSLQSARHIPLYTILAAPLIAAALTSALAARGSLTLPEWARQLLAELQRFGADIAPIDNRPRFYAASGLVTLLVIAVFCSPSGAGRLKTNQPRFDPKVFPAGAADYLERTAFSGDVFSTDQWSSYLIYRAFPRVRVFMDGRSDYYGRQMGELYLSLLAVHHTWERTLDQYRVDLVVLPVDSGLAGALKESVRWKVLYDDGVALIFERAGSASARLVAAERGSNMRTQEVRQ